MHRGPLHGTPVATPSKTGAWFPSGTPDRKIKNAGTRTPRAAVRARGPLSVRVARGPRRSSSSVGEGDPKTDVNDATIALDSGTAAVLKAHKARQNEERLAWGEACQGTGRIFTREDEAELHPGWVSELFERLVFEAGLPPIRLHDLRHGAATLVLAPG